MMKMKMLVLGVTLFLGALLQTAKATEVIKIGTLVPASSSWAQVFKVLADAVNKQSNGKIEIQFFYNGLQGDEAAMVGKMKSGQIDGAAISSVGLGKIYKPITAMEMPGLFSNWATLDLARETMKSEFEKGIRDGGFMLAGWYDIGAVHLMSKGFAIRTPDDIKGKKPYLWRDDNNLTALYQIIGGGVTPVPLNMPEVLPNLNTGGINALFSSSLVAEQFQWGQKLDQMTDAVDGIAIGGIVFTSKRIDALPEDLKAILLGNCKTAAGALTKKIRNDDAAAFSRMKAKMTLVVRTPAEQLIWNAIFKQMRQKLAQGTYSADLVTKLEKLAGK